MYILPNNCKCSEISVTPKNWQNIKKTKKPWILFYRFYDPVLCPQGKMFQYRGVNHYKDADIRRKAMEIMIYEIKDQLINQGFNPVANTIQPPDYSRMEIEPDTPFIVALKAAFKKIVAVPGTLTDIASVIKGVEQSAVALNLDRLPINKVSRKYIKQILEHRAINNMKYESSGVKGVKGTLKHYWSSNRFNKYRTYLIRLFKELVEMESIDSNPIYDISKMKQFIKQRVILTPEQKTAINETVYRVNKPFWKVLQIFFHSGSRITELCGVKKHHIDIVNHRCKYTVKKGTSVREVWRPIKDVVFNIWMELYKQAADDDYLISEGLVPGKNRIRPEQISRRWTRIVKKGMGINVDFYSLKHLNTTEMMDELSLMDHKDPAAEVSKLNGHTSSSMLRKVYDVRYVDRENEKLRKVGNTFE